MYDHEGVTPADPTPPPAAEGRGEPPAGAEARDETAAAEATAATPAEAGPAAPVGRLRRPNPVRDMAISLGVLVVPLLVLMAFCRPQAADIETVDASRTYRAASAEAKYPVREPAGLPSGWRATSASVNRLAGGPITLRVSYITPSSKYIQVVQSDIPSETLIPQELGGGKIQGRTEIGAVVWHRYAGRRGDETALVLLDPKVTVVVTGDAPVGELTAFAALLR